MGAPRLAMLEWIRLTCITRDDRQNHLDDFAIGRCEADSEVVDSDSEVIDEVDNEGGGDGFT
jgi:hypothetical protein